MSAARQPEELRELPAVAVCATCGDPSCPGHDHEMSGERPIRRQLPWEDGETPAFRALWRTAMLSAGDLDLWARASAHDVGGVGPSLTFAIACETVAVVSILAPLGILFGLLVHQLTHDLALLGSIAGLVGRLAAVFIPVMIVIHVVYQWTLARAGNRLGTTASRGAVLRAGLYACGWDLATGPAGVLASLVSGELREARRRARGNSTLFRDAATEWLRHAHALEGSAADPARKAPSRSMTALVVVAVALSGWAFVASFGR